MGEYHQGFVLDILPLTWKIRISFVCIQRNIIIISKCNASFPLWVYNFIEGVVNSNFQVTRNQISFTHSLTCSRLAFQVYMAISIRSVKLQWKPFSGKFTIKEINGPDIKKVVWGWVVSVQVKTHNNSALLMKCKRKQIMNKKKRPFGIFFWCKIIEVPY